ncbi:MAG: DUF6941 family protein [Candidatus Brocadiia bacterium]
MSPESPGWEPAPGAARRPPELQYSVPCDDFRQEAGGKFLFIGVFETLRAAAFPYVHPAATVVNRWTDGEGEFVERTRVLGSEGAVVAEGRDLGFALDPQSVGYTVVTRFVNLAFPAPGIYWVEVLLDGEVRRRYPLLVEEDEGS